MCAALTVLQEEAAASSGQQHSRNGEVYMQVRCGPRVD
jgi:hypothetical protein